METFVPRDVAQLAVIPINVWHRRGVRTWSNVARKRAQQQHKAEQQVIHGLNTAKATRRQKEPPQAALAPGNEGSDHPELVQLDAKTGEEAKAKECERLRARDPAARGEREIIEFQSTCAFLSSHNSKVIKWLQCRTKNGSNAGF